MYISAFFENLLMFFYVIMSLLLESELWFCSYKKYSSRIWPLWSSSGFMLLHGTNLSLVHYQLKVSFAFLNLLFILVEYFFSSLFMKAEVFLYMCIVAVWIFFGSLVGLCFCVFDIALWVPASILFGWLGIMDLVSCCNMLYRSYGQFSWTCSFYNIISWPTKNGSTCYKNVFKIVIRFIFIQRQFTVIYYSLRQFPLLRQFLSEKIQFDLQKA